MEILNQDKLDKETAAKIRARGQALNKEMVKKDAFLKSGRKNVTMA